VKYADFEIATRSVSRDHPIVTAEELLSLAERLLSKTRAKEKSVRLLGVMISNLTTDIPAEEVLQMKLQFV
jgi:DNA polymerase-4